MTNDELIEIGKKAGLCDEEGRDDNSIIITNHMGRFANFVIDKERKKWIELTDKEILDALKCLDSQTARLPKGFRLFAQSISSILKEKNT